MRLNVNEIFYSLQGEGGRMGEPSVFIRLTRCNLACSFCDTDFQKGTDMTMDDILNAIRQYPCKWIIWTGGEPTLQLTDEHLSYFKELGYRQAIETNGTNTVPSLIDYISCSPKGNFQAIKIKNPSVNEIRIPLTTKDTLPDIEELPAADKYFISPVFNNDKPDFENIAHCVRLVKENPKWTLSLQMHKLINIE